MFCPICGTTVKEGSKFCPRCGRDLMSERRSTPQPNTTTPPAPVDSSVRYTPPQPVTSVHTTPPTPPNPGTTTNPVTPLGANGRITSEQRKQIVSDAERSGIGMKWYKFITYFSLIAGAVVSFGNAFAFFTGVTYRSEGLEPEGVYRMFPPLKTVDSVAGVACLVAIGLYIYTFILMMRLSKQGPKFLNFCYVINAGITVFHNIGLCLVLKAPLSTASTQIVGSVIGCVVWILINKKYFENRAHLFQYE